VDDDVMPPGARYIRCVTNQGAERSVS